MLQRCYKDVRHKKGVDHHKPTFPGSPCFNLHDQRMFTLRDWET